MKFLSGYRLWLLAAVAAMIVVYIAVQGRRNRYVVRFTNLALLGVVAPRRPAWRRHVPALAFLFCIAALVIGFARPTTAQRVPRDRATIVMAIDVSLSMEATDVEPSRIDAAKAAAKSFVDLLPARFNLGIVAFAGTAQVLVSPTTDHIIAKRAIDGFELRQGTAIGEGVFASLEAIRSVPTDPGQEPPPAHIVLMSDGETTTGRPNEQAAIAAIDARVPVSTIAYGTEDGFIVFENRRIRVPVNGDALHELATQTHGTFFEAVTGDQLRKVYQDVGTSVGFVEEQREVGVWFLGFGLLFALAAGVASLTWFSRLP